MSKSAHLAFGGGQDPSDAKKLVACLDWVWNEESKLTGSPKLENGDLMLGASTLFAEVAALNVIQEFPKSSRL